MQTINPSLDDHKLTLTRDGLRFVPYGEGRGFPIRNSNLFSAQCQAINRGYWIDIDAKHSYSDDNLWAYYLMALIADLRFDQCLSPEQRAIATKEVLEFLRVEETTKARRQFFQLVRRLQRLARNT